jgi:hypothetical protein
VSILSIVAFLKSASCRIHHTHSYRGFESCRARQYFLSIPGGYVCEHETDQPEKGGNIRLRCRNRLGNRRSNAQVMTMALIHNVTGTKRHDRNRPPSSMPQLKRSSIT